MKGGQKYMGDRLGTGARNHAKAHRCLLLPTRFGIIIYSSLARMFHRSRGCWSLRSISRMVAKNVDDFQKEELQELFQAYEALGASKSEIKKAMNQESGSRFSSMMFVMIVILIALTLIVWRI
ncbi:unnamed protein product [Durusdinium trenchii]|uniref:Uncharacterized protein n=1 Tax=Durusdinium trenchii TaxID=1381693 RepID=A0ABP0T1D3_9DINO